MRFVVDTNVAVVANGVPTSQDGANGRAPSIACRTASIEFLQSLLRNHKILLDNKGQIQNEYRRHLKPNGQPGTGDRFYLEVLNSHPDRVERVELPVGANGQYVG